MDVENRIPAENINSQADRLHLEAFWMIAGGIAAVLVLLLATWFVGAYLAPLVPFEYEIALAKTGIGQIDSATQPTTEPRLDAPRLAAEMELQRLVNQLRDPLDIPKDIPITVHLNNQSIDNAFASFGGHNVILAGLVGRLESEEAITALLAHEMAHVKHRHVARSLGRGLTVTFAASLISSELASYLGHIMMSAEGIAMASFSRDQESLCDLESLMAAQKLYGHVYGVLDLMRHLDLLAQDKEAGGLLLRSHPFTSQRIMQAKQWQQSHPSDIKQSSVSLSTSLKTYLNASH